MACETVGTDRSLLVVWGIPEIADADRVAKQVQLRTELTGKPILYAMRLPIGAPAPSPAVRRHLCTYMPALASCCDEYHVILEGDGFAAATKRGVLTSISRYWRKRGVFHVHSTVGEFVRKASPEWRAEITRLLHLAEQRGLLEGPLPVDRANLGSGHWVRGAKHEDPKRQTG